VDKGQKKTTERDRKNRKKKQCESMGTLIVWKPIGLDEGNVDNAKNG